MVPPAPARFSTTTCCPQVSDRCCPRIRDTTSAIPPGGKGTINLTGLLGHAWLMTQSGHRAKESKKAALNNVQRIQVQLNKSGVA